MAEGPVEKIAEVTGNDCDYLTAIATLNMHAGAEQEGE